MSSGHVAIATCDRAQDLDEDRTPTLEALGRRGITATAQAWDDASVDWSAFDLVVIRSTWDYTAQRERFLAWAAELPRLANPYDVIEWNTDKRYLADLLEKGVAAVPTTWVEPGGDVLLPDGEIVIKPSVGAGAFGSGRYGPDEHEAALRHAHSLLDAGFVVMAQPYLESFDRDGERGLVYLGDRFSHAIYKPSLLSQRGPYVVGTLTSEIIEKAEPTDEERSFAETVLDAVPAGRDRLLYARVDIVHGDDDKPVLVELEATEPHLYFVHGAGSADRFAEAVEETLARA